MQPLLALSRAIDRLNRALGVVAAWLTLLMILIGALNTVLRYLDSYTGGGLSSNAFLEAQWFLFSLVFLLGAAYTLRRDGHVRVDVFYGRLSERGKAWIDLVGGVAFLIPFCAFALWVSWPFVMRAWDSREISPDPSGLPFYPLKTAMLVAFALLGLQSLSEIIKRGAFLLGRSAEEIGLSEPHPTDTEGA